VAIEVAVIVSRKFRARQKVCPDLVQGIHACGDKTVVFRADQYPGPHADVAIFYGFDGSRHSQLAKAFDDYKRAGKKAIYVDLGYFSQHWNGDRYGYHRFSINDRHPTAYFQNVKHLRDRFMVHGRRVAPDMKQGKNILLCGMSQKCAEFEGFKFEEWEREAIGKIRAVTDRPIVYRPKPKRKREPQSPPIECVSFSDPSRTRIEQEFADAWAVVSHHSNACIDGLLAGVPSFSDEGVSTALGLSDLSMIESPRLPNIYDRLQFAYDVAYCQFNRPEMRDGTAWRHFKDEGLIP
jgi:hypothetical protein